MATAGAGPFTNKVGGGTEPGRGVEYGIPPGAIEAGPGGAVQVEVPADVADRFHAAQAKHGASAGGVASNIDTATHKTGLEPGAERQRDMTEVAQAKAASGGQAETRTPEIGFPGGSGSGQ